MSGAVEIERGKLVVVRGLAHVLFEVDARELHHLARIGDALLRILRIRQIIQRHATAQAEREGHLRDLVVLRHVRVEVVFAVPVHHGWRGAAQHHPGEDRLLDRGLVQHRQRPGQSEASRAGVRVWLRPIFHRAGAEHLAARRELRVNFEADGDDVFGHAERKRTSAGRSKREPGTGQRAVGGFFSSPPQYILTGCGGGGWRYTTESMACSSSMLAKMGRSSELLATLSTLGSCISPAKSLLSMAFRTSGS